jgi:hypothetical protein
MTDQELKDLVASLALDTQALKAQVAAFQAEAAERAAAAAKLQAQRDAEEEQRIAKRIKENRKTDRQLRELGKQIGGIGNKFGLFMEGIAMPSVQKLLLKRFGVEDYFQNRLKRKGEDSMELDALGLVNGSHMEAYIVEVKSNLRTEDVAQLQTTVRRFRHLFSEYNNYKVFGVLAVAKANDNTLQQAWQEGFYVIDFDKHLMRVHEPEGFMPTVF